MFSRQNVEVHDLFVGNFVDEHQQSFLAEMSAYVAAGEVRYKEHFYDGLAVAPKAFADMLAGRNFGKTIVTVAQP